MLETLKLNENFVSFIDLHFLVNSIDKDQKPIEGNSDKKNMKSTEYKVII